MRPSLVLAAALALCAGACGDGPARWAGSWTLDRERSARSVVDFGIAERAEMKRMMQGAGADPEKGAPKGPPPNDEELMAHARGWMRGMAADLELKADGSARAELYFGGVRVTYTGTWSKSGDGAEMQIVSRADGILQGPDGLPLRFRRDAEFLVIGGETDAKGKPGPEPQTNTAVPRRSMYLTRK